MPMFDLIAITVNKSTFAHVDYKIKLKTHMQFIYLKLLIKGLMSWAIHSKDVKCIRNQWERTFTHFNGKTIFNDGCNSHVDF